MVHMRAGEKKRKLILDTSKKLFYKKGFKNTTYVDIARAADIPQGSISYHFDDKAAIGLAIRAEFEQEDYKYTHRLADAFNLNFRERAVVGLLHYWKLIFEDSSLRRFLVEVTKNGAANIDRIEETRRYYLPLLRECGITDLDADQLNLIAAAHVGIELALLELIDCDINRYDYKQIALFFITERFRLAGIQPDQYEEAIARGLEIFDQIPYDYGFYRNFRFR